MVSDHKKDVKEFEKATKNLSDPELKAFAEKTLPTLQEHLTQAQNLDAQLKGK
jgi:putative membrane protein